jgi:hypothetical protein
MGSVSRGHSRAAVADESRRPEIVRLFQSLQAEGFRFLIAGMSAAVLQGVSVTTFDTDIWMDLPSRSYIKVINLCSKLGAEILANTVAILKDGTEINFLYQVTGLRAFAKEFKEATTVTWHGVRVRVLPLERLIASKAAIRRPKDLIHLHYLRTALRARRLAKAK